MMLSKPFFFFVAPCPCTPHLSRGMFGLPASKHQKIKNKKGSIRVRALVTVQRGVRTGFRDDSPQQDCFFLLCAKPNKCLRNTHKKNKGQKKKGKLLPELGEAPCSAGSLDTVVRNGECAVTLCPRRRRRGQCLSLPRGGMFVSPATPCSSYQVFNANHQTPRYNAGALKSMSKTVLTFRVSSGVVLARTEVRCSPEAKRPRKEVLPSGVCGPSDSLQVTG